MTSASRYQGKPLLRLLECYVLWVIDQLPETDSRTLQEMTPKLQMIYAADGNWQQILGSVLQLPSNLSEEIMNAWAKNIKTVRESGGSLTPQEFAEMFVDINLVAD